MSSSVHATAQGLDKGNTDCRYVQPSLLEDLENTGLELVQQYVAGLNQVIEAGADLRTTLNGVSVSVLNIAIDEHSCDVVIAFLHADSLFDKTAHVPLRTQFTLEFSDYPNQLRAAGWG